jgi:hypothetical protein
MAEVGVPRQMFVEIDYHPVTGDARLAMRHAEVGR